MKLYGRHLVLIGILASLLLPGCGSEPKTELAPLPSPEIYDWGGQPISVSSPPEGWYREKTQQGGLSGARFIKSGSVGEEIRLAEHYSLDERDRCERIQALIDEYETMEQRDFLKAIHKANLYANPAIHRSEADQVELANNELGRARMAFLGGDMMETYESLSDALKQAQKVNYTLDDVIDRVMFTPRQYDSFGKVLVEPSVAGEVGGEPSVSVDFTLDSRDRKVLFHGRQVYVLKNNRLFVLAFLGLPENLPLFQRIVDSVSFPEGVCAH